MKIVIRPKGCGYYQFTIGKKFKGPKNILKNMNINATQILFLHVILSFSRNAFFIQG